MGGGGVMRRRKWLYAYMVDVNASGYQGLDDLGVAPNRCEHQGIDAIPL